MIRPSKVISIECGVCRRDRRPCTSKHCALNKAGRSLERIKAHCRDCAPDHRVEECSGQIVGTQAKALNVLYQIPLVDGKAECPLFPFRFGKNPERKKRTFPEHLKPFLFTAKQGRLEKKETFSEGERIESPAGAGIGQIQAR